MSVENVASVVMVFSDWCDDKNDDGNERRDDCFHMNDSQVHNDGDFDDDNNKSKEASFLDVPSFVLVLPTATINCSRSMQSTRRKKRSGVCLP